MSKSREEVTLPTITKTTPRNSFGPIFQKSFLRRTKSDSDSLPSISNGGDLVVRQNVKRLSLWFKTWHTWQQRIFICRVMEHCSKQHLEFLATSLEPILHLDFSSSLVPPLAALHLDGVATFQVQRSIMQSVLKPGVLEAETSLAYLSSVPTTLLTDSTGHSRLDGQAVISHEGSKTTITAAVERGSILPALPLTHLEHAAVMSSQKPNLEEAIQIRRKRFSSVPDFKSTTDLLKHVRHKGPFRAKQGRRRSRSTGAYSSSRKSNPVRDRFAELFKGQLAMVSEWMVKWEAPQKAFLLLEVVKLCNKELLGYFVQCLYQRLQDRVSIDTLPDSLLLAVFTYLDPQSLCRCSQVCLRWRRLCSSPELWRAHCCLVGRREGVGDLVGAVEMGHRGGAGEGEGGSEAVIDWKRAYRDLRKVMARIKGLVIKAATAAAEQEELEHQMSAKKLSSAALRTNMSLKKMIEMVRARSPMGVATTQEVVRSAPESAATVRSRLRAERRVTQELKEKEEKGRLESSKYHHRRPYNHGTLSSRVTPMGHLLSPDFSLLATAPLEVVALGDEVEGGMTRDIITLIQVALDSRPSIPYLPDPDGIQCLILAGCLMAGHAPKPGRVQPIPRLRRLWQFDATVLCLQCDQRKVVSGTASREILIHDVRSGRHVHTLQGHKGSVQCLQFDDHKIVSGSWDTTCIVWDVVHFTAIKSLHGHMDCVSCLQFDDERLVTGSYDKSLRIWSTTTWDCMTIIGGAHKGIVTSLRLNDSIIASGSSDKSVKLWSLGTSQSMATLEHEAGVTSLQLSNLLLISACSDGGVYLWSLHSHSILMQWMVPGGSLAAMTMAGSRIFGAGSDSAVYEWDIATGTCTRTLTGHSRPLTCVWAGHYKLVTAAEDHTVCVWYYKQAIVKSDEVDELDPDFMEIPIRVITQ